jgi:aryl-alcohol dehydrogenase-like predicted oxidoreductase
MQKRQLGTGGPMVSAIGLGCLSFGGIFGATTRAESLDCLDAAWEAGIDWLDTANVYGMGVSESVIGEWMATRGHRPLIATKAGITRGADGGVAARNDAAHLRDELEGSLRRLGVDHVDLFYIHRREFSRPLDEVIGTLADLVAEGKIGGYGLSEVAPATVRQAHALHPCRAVQNEYSLWTRLPELGMIQTCAALGIAFVPFSPLARGALGEPPLDPALLDPGEFRLQIPRFQGANWAENRRHIDTFRTFARERGWSAPALALAWCLDQGPHLLPIPGTRTAGNLRAWAGAADIALTDEHRAGIARILPVGWAWGDRYDDRQARSVERYC